MKRFVFTFVLLGLGFLCISMQAEESWSVLKRMTWTNNTSQLPTIAVDSTNQLHVIWSEAIGGYGEIFYKSSTDSGISWSFSKRLTWNSGDSTLPYLAVDSGDNLHVVWSDDSFGNYEIFHKKSTNGGTSWTAPNRLVWTSGITWQPRIAIDSGNNLHVVYYDTTPGKSEIYYKKSSNGGTSWSAVKRLTWNSGNSQVPFLAVDSNNTLHLFWQDGTPGVFEIFYKNSLDGGNTWSGAIRLTWNTNWSMLPVAAVDTNDDIHLVWRDGATIPSPDAYEIYYRKSTNSGTSWSGLKRLTWNSGNSTFPWVITDPADNPTIVWSDQTPGNWEVYFKESSDGGNSWGGLTRLTWNSGDSLQPIILIDLGSDMHVVWYDDSPGNNEIFYKNRK